MKPAILLLSGGSLVGQNVVQALGQRRKYLQLLATNSVADEPSLQDFDEVRLAPPTEGQDKQLAALVVDWMAATDIRLVVPCRDDDVAFLARLAERRPDIAPRLLCGAPKVADAMLDKWASWQFSASAGLPFAPSALATDRNAVRALVERHGFPMIVKPRAGFASRGVRLLLEDVQVECVVGDESMLVQKYLGEVEPLLEFNRTIRGAGLPLFHSFESVKHSIQAMIAPDGELAGVFATIHRMRQGMSVGVEDDPAEDALSLGRRCAAVFASHGWRGPLNIQCHRGTNGELGIYEFNGRFTGATAARALLGFDEVGLGLRLFGGWALDQMTALRGGAVVRQTVSRRTPADLREALEQSGRWCRS